MGWFDWLDGRSEEQQARDNSNSDKGVTKYKQSLVPGDDGYLCNGCGQSLTGGFLGMGHCRC